jgi:uncharacterized zinc-type alcohol dehydrogenase-like protein
MATVKDGKGTLALAAFDSKCELKKHEFGRPAPGENDVAIEIKFCGMCHSDIHACNGDWGVNKYPIAPGHEIAGVVTAVGSGVSDLSPGDNVGVGCMVQSCGDCDLCKRGLQQHCPGMIQTYSSEWPENKGADECRGYWTNGGYSTAITVNRKFVFKVKEGVPLEYAGPLLCAGITTYSPLARHIKGKSGQKVGVLGFGGLGHMAVKIAKAMGAEVTVFSRSDKKKAAAEKLGANLVVESDKDTIAKMSRTFDVVLDTVSAKHDTGSILPVLKVEGVLVLLGVPPEHTFATFPLIFSRLSVEGSLIGGVEETQEMLDFCAEHKILPDIDVIHAKAASDAFQQIAAGNAPAARHVIDMSTLASL